MKVEKETTPTIAAQDERKKGSFLIRQDYLKTACHFLTNEELGAVFRNINDFVTDPQHVAQLDPLPNMCYYQLTEGIKQENEKYYKILARRQANYQDMKRRAASFGKNNSNKNDKNDETAETSENEKNDFSNRIGKDNALVYGKDKEGNATEGIAADRNATEGNGTQEVVNTTSYKEYDIIKYKIFFNNELYTRNYLREKKMFLTQKGWEAFWNYNNNELHWPYRPETAFRRWIKQNPGDEMKPREEKKTPLEQPRTPAALKALHEELFDVVRETVSAYDFRTWLTDLFLIEVKNTVDGDELTFSTSRRFKAEYIRENHEENIRAVYKRIKNREVKNVTYKFVDGSKLFLLQNITLQPKEEAKKYTPMPESLRAHKEKLNSAPAVYVDADTQTEKKLN